MANNSMTHFIEQAQKSTAALAATGFNSYAKEVENILNGARHECFSVAVVGEFNRGKSSLINHILCRNVLPVGDLPTTAIMTKIHFGESETIRLFDASDNEVACRQLADGAFEELKLHHFEGNDFSGRAEISVSDQWLHDANVVIYDTPGAGDLDESRAQLIGDMLWRCDGIIVTINATSALSLTERLFIEERIIARKFSSVMVVVTKLDLVDESERPDVMHFIKKRLGNWNLNVPVCVADSNMLPESLRDEFGGLESVKSTIQSWSSSPNRTENKCIQVKSNVFAILESALASLSSQLALSEEESSEKRNAMIAQKKLRLQEAKVAWETLNTELQKKCTACYSLFTEKVDEYAASICERLQFEAGHANDPKRWWQEDYPYRAKIELVNLAVNAESVVSRQIASDVRWYNNELGRIFKAVVPYSYQTIVDKPIGGFDVNSNLEVENLDRRRTLWRIGSAVLMISGAAFCTATGCWPLVATIGLGTGTSILTEKFLKSKIEAQREAMRQEIAVQLPLLIQQATAKAEMRLTEVYEKIVKDGEAYEQQWLAGQNMSIEGTVDAVGNLAIAGIRDKIAKLNDAMSIL